MNDDMERFKAGELLGAIDEMEPEELGIDEDDPTSVRQLVHEELTDLLAGRIVKFADSPQDEGHDGAFRRGPLSLSSAEDLAEAITEKLIGMRVER